MHVVSGITLYKVNHKFDRNMVILVASYILNGLMALTNSKEIPFVLKLHGLSPND